MPGQKSKVVCMLIYWKYPTALQENIMILADTTNTHHLIGNEEITNDANELHQ